MSSFTCRLFCKQATQTADDAAAIVDMDAAAYDEADVAEPISPRVINVAHRAIDLELNR